MKRLFATLMVLMLGAIGLSHDHLANAGEYAVEIGTVQEEAQAKDMYLAYAAPSRQGTKKRRGRPGARVRIELLRDGVKKFVPIDSTFRAGDKVKFHFAVNFPAHVSVINLGTSGRLSLLFPYQGAPEVVGTTKNYSVPHQNDLWFEFDEKPGVERLTFVFSAVRLMPAGVSPSQAQTSTPSGNSGSVTVNPAGDQQAALDDLNSRALTNGKDLNLVQVSSSNEGYVLCDEEQLRKPVGFQISLKHK